MNRTRHIRCAAALIAALIALSGSSAQALIERIYSLQEIMDESKVILTGRIDKVNEKTKAAIISVDSTIKGKTAFRKINMNIAVGQAWHPDVLMKRLKPGAPALVFYNIDGQSISCVVHTDGIFFQLFAEQRGEPDQIWWRFTHIELLLRRTYDGPTQELTELVRRVAASQAKPPAPNPKVNGWTRQSLLDNSTQTEKLAGDDAFPPIFSDFVSLPHGGGEAHGVAWADYDGDGDFDALICSSSGIRLYRYSTSQKRFFDETSVSGLRGGGRCASWADYNGDGRPDLFVVPASGRPTLWTNTGRQFSDSTALLPDLRNWNGEGAGWIDADGDGRPDLLLTNGEHGIFLLLNGGAANPFKDVSSAWNLGPKGMGRANGDFLAIADYDSDGWAEFLYNVGRGLMAHNQEGERFKPAEKARIEYLADNAWKIGPAFADFDNDGNVDLFIPQRDKSRLYRNDGDGTFTDVIDRVSDLSMLRNARSAAWGDVNADGMLDLVVGFADRPIRLFINEGEGRFSEQTDTAVAPDALEKTRGVAGMAFADYDRDGRLDLLLAGDGGASGVLVNSAPAAKPARGALRVRLPYSCSPGAIVRLYDSKDRLAGLRQVGLVQNFSSQEPPEAFFAVAPGQYKVAILLTDGQAHNATVNVPADGLLWKLEIRN